MLAGKSGIRYKLGSPREGFRGCGGRVKSKIITTRGLSASGACAWGSFDWIPEAEMHHDMSGMQKLIAGLF